MDKYGPYVWITVPNIQGVYNETAWLGASKCTGKDKVRSRGKQQRILEEKFCESGWIW
jgi:hypothetical protein